MKFKIKASIKLNPRGQVYDGLVSIEPDQEDFLKLLDSKNRPKIKPQINSNKVT
jgi:hypothetical protein